jgi:hypothetical protein
MGMIQPEVHDVLSYLETIRDRKERAEHDYESLNDGENVCLYLNDKAKLDEVTATVNKIGAEVERLRTLERLVAFDARKIVDVYVSKLNNVLSGGESKCDVAIFDHDLGGPAYVEPTADDYRREMINVIMERWK